MLISKPWVTSLSWPWNVSAIHSLPGFLSIPSAFLWFIHWLVFVCPWNCYFLWSFSVDSHCLFSFTSFSRERSWSSDVSHSALFRYQRKLVWPRGPGVYHGCYPHRNKDLWELVRPSLSINSKLWFPENSGKLLWDADCKMCWCIEVAERWNRHTIWVCGVGKLVN